MKTLIVADVLLAGAVTVGAGTRAAAAESCNPVGKLDFVCGPLNSEDLVQVPGTKWIVSSGMDGGAAGSHGMLHMVNAQNKSWKVLFPGKNPQLRPDKATYGDCPGAPDLSKFSAHGLNLRPGANGGRESIEIFALDAKGENPR